MKYHVLPGDSTVEEFKKTKIDGEIIVCREAFIVGPATADAPDEFWDDRARFVLAEYAEDEIDFHERVADELEKLTDIDDDDEVYLWFEYELFCSVNMWFCLSQLAGSGATVFRVEPAILSEKDRWSGFGQLGGDELQRCFDARQLFSAADIKLGTDLWNAYRHRKLQELAELAEEGSPRFPYLFEVAKAASEMETRPFELLKDIKAEGKTEFDEIFREFVKRAGVYGFGDLQVQGMVDRM